VRLSRASCTAIPDLRLNCPVKNHFVPLHKPVAEQRILIFIKSPSRQFSSADQVPIDRWRKVDRSGGNPHSHSS
jgi:hypothetical protein